MKALLEINEHFFDELYTVSCPAGEDNVFSQKKGCGQTNCEIDGHVHGIMEMVNDGRSYSEIVQQMGW